jgi:phospholipid/cholesterol/gamma-HCH transport system substrate-binding protein
MIGVSVLIAIGLMMGFTYWLMKPSVDSEVTKYHILFDESVLGLNVDAAVKYRGITVGKVTSLKICSKNLEQVDVLITILKSTPIKETTVAKLTSQGITGLSYINLSMGSLNDKDLIAQDGEEYPTIKSIPSFFENIETSLGTVSSKLSNTLTQTEKLLNDENQKQISILLNRAAKVMDKVDKALDEETINNLQASAKNMNELTYKIDKMLPKINNFVEKSVKWEDKISTAFESIMVSYLGIRGSMDEIKRAISSGEFNIKEIAGDVVPTLNNTLLDMQELMIRIDGLIEQYERSPGDILFKQEEPKKGPGE